MNILFALFLAAHGVAHLVGFAVPWGLVESPQTPHKTTILAGAVDLGEAGIRTFGVLWLLLALAFLVAAAAVLAGQPWAARWLWIATVASLVASALDWPEARIGVFVNVALLVLLSLSARVAWLSFVTGGS
jgi:hypothetical protein